MFNGSRPAALLTGQVGGSFPSLSSRFRAASTPHHGTRAEEVGQMTNPRSTPQYQAWRTKVLTQCEPVCIRCGYPVDMTLKGSHPDGPSADHEPPLAITGEATPSLDGAGIAHLSCNRSHGGRLGSQRAQANAQAKRNGKPATKTETRSLSKALLTPAAPHKAGKPHQPG